MQSCGLHLHCDRWTLRFRRFSLLRGGNPIRALAKIPSVLYSFNHCNNPAAVTSGVNNVHNSTSSIHL